MESRHAAAGVPADKHKPIGLLLLIALVALTPLLIFFPVVGFGFLEWDDPQNITQNPLYQPTPLAHLADIWTKPYFSAYLPITRTVWALLATPSTTAGGAPITIFNPADYHAANLCVHVANTLLVFFVLRVLIARLISAGSGNQRRDLAAALGALLFAVHPLQVETVAWASGFRDLLCGFFSLLAILAYLKATQAGSLPARQWPWLGAASSAFLLALLCKSAAVALPPILLLVDWLICGKVPSQRLLLLTLWLPPAIAVSLVTKYAENTQSPSHIPIVPAWQRPFVAGDSFAFYLSKLFAPIRLGADYGRLPTWLMSHSWAYLPILAPIALVAIAWRSRNKAPWLTAAIGLFLIELTPVSGIVPFAYQAYSTVADRYAYFAMLGPALALAAALTYLPWRRAAAIGGIVLICLIFATVQQLPVWANTTTLFTQSLLVNPNSPIAQFKVARELEKQDKLDQAIPHLRAGERLSPDNCDFHCDLGISLLRLWMEHGSKPTEIGMLQEAKAELEAAIRLQGEQAAAHHNLGYVYYRLNRLDDAIEQYRIAIEQNPGDPSNYCLLAISYAHAGNHSQAQSAMQQAADMGYAPAIANLKIPQEQW